MSNFSLIKFKDFAFVNPGQSPKSEYYSDNEGVPFLQGNRTFGLLYPTIDTYTRKTTKLAFPGEILMSVRAPVGDLNFAKDIVCIGRGIASIKANDGNNQFLFYCLKYNIHNLIRQGGGTTYDSVNKDVINDFELIMPSLNIERETIAKVLSDLDAKIELNNKINAELEAMAKLIYDYWFVQFEFPVCNEDGTLSAAEGYKSSGGKMFWNEELKRKVPEGWEVKKLSDIANITMGQSPPGESYNEEKIGTIFYQGCTDFGKRFPTIRKYTTQPTRFAQISDILLSVRAPVGTMNIAKEECCIGRGLAALNSKNDCMPYLFGVMSNLKQIFDRRNTDGTTFGAITKDDLFSIKVISPSDELIKKFDKIVGPMFSQQNTNEFQNNELAELRDWLLPMLMNGQVRVETNT